jgi:hypothetical protein
MSSEIKYLEEQRKQLRSNLRNTDGVFSRLLYFFKRRKWQKEYEYLGLVWGQKFPWNQLRGLDLTGAILLNDEGKKIDSDTFKQIANEKIMGKSNAPEYHLKAEFHDSGPGQEIPASEVFDDPYGDYVFKVYQANLEANND